ncbi:hypothetical protein KDK_56550 [Dictyobacter kobayashii]|uniref:Uncharacterized protein n=1 Tax=Dictyobacter kobayashii TaxID=2014872 RepID=A0A402ARX9_9CHLR|nr:hypothetical protein KDK_56550 [Dictyobacter kobayashii]
MLAGFALAAGDAAGMVAAGCVVEDFAAGIADVLDAGVVGVVLAAGFFAAKTEGAE